MKKILGSVRLKIWERNITFPPLADALEITFDDRVGRYVKATRNIKAG